MNLFSKKRHASGVVGLSINDERVMLAQMLRGSAASGGGPYLQACSQQAVSSAAQSREVLKALVDSLGLAGARCNYALASRDYDVYLIEAPSVEPAEMKSAVRWRIKDLLDMPVEDAVIDIFPVPKDAFQGRSKMLYAVAAQKSRVESVIDLVNGAGLTLNAIDIPELAMLNMSSELLDDQNGLAFIDLRQTGSTMNLSRGGQLYLTRKINTQLGADVMTAFDWEVQRDRLVLEMQRSLDYYESQMGQNPISQIVLAPRPNDAAAIAASLSEVMSVRVSVMDIAEQLAMAEDIAPATLQACVVAIGAALRADKAVDV